MCRAGLNRLYGETKRNPARISETAGKTQLIMAAFRPDDAKPLGAGASLPCVRQHFVSLDFVNDVEYQKGYAKKRVISTTAVPTIFPSKLSDSRRSVGGLGGNVP